MPFIILDQIVAKIWITPDRHLFSYREIQKRWTHNYLNKTRESIISKTNAQLLFLLDLQEMKIAIDDRQSQQYRNSKPQITKSMRSI